MTDKLDALAEDGYMSAPEAKTFRALIEGLQMLAEHTKDRLDGAYPISAEHDVMWCDGDIDPRSPQADRLRALGWHWDNDVERWAWFA